MATPTLVQKGGEFCGAISSGAPEQRARGPMVPTNQAEAPNGWKERSVHEKFSSLRRRAHQGKLVETEQNCSGARFHLDGPERRPQFPIRGVG